MDTSETYIRLCEKAVEIQGEWFPILGDWICSAVQTTRNKKSNRNVRVVQYVEDKRGYPIIHSRESMGTMDAKHRCYVAWLPRQDQLQEMLGGFDACLVLLHRELDADSTDFGLLALTYDEATGGMGSLWSYFKSMEQLWLAFVMKEKYGKVWDGTNWVK